MNNDDFRPEDKQSGEQYPYSSFYEGSSYSYSDGSRRKKGHGGGFILLLVVVLVVAAAYAFLQRFEVRLVQSSDGNGWSLSVTDRDGEILTQPEESQLPDFREPEDDSKFAHQSSPVSAPTAAPTGDGTELAVAALPQGETLTLQQIYQKVSPCVVGVSSTGISSISTGTGIIMTDDGYIITNYHVIDGSLELVVELEDGEQYAAAIVGGDEVSDLAVIKIDAQNLTAAEFGDSDALLVGDEVAAIGNPLGLELKGTLTNGIVSAINRDIKMDGRSMTLIQTNAALNAGNSGGPLINGHGQVVGINTMKLSSYLSSIEGLGFAIPISAAKPIVDQLIQQGYVTGRPALGITGRDVTPRASIYYRIPGGVLINIVQQGSGAEAAGIEPGDIIVAVEGQEISGMDDLNSIKNRFEAGDSITLTIYRGGEEYSVDVELMDASETEN